MLRKDVVLISAIVLMAFCAYAFSPTLAEANIGFQKINALPVETRLSVPFYYQNTYYYCGPACLQMVFNYYGENISQSEIAAVARTIGDPWYETYTDELRRAGQFSNLSTSMGKELPYNITGYTMRKLGYAAFESQGMNLTTMETLVNQGKPLILLMWYSGNHSSGHFRVVTGYNQTHVFVHDPWNKPLWGGTYGGPDLAFNNAYFLDLWSYFGNWALYVSPWKVTISAPTYVKVDTPFQLNSTIFYPPPLPNAFSYYPASSCNASISLPTNLTLAQGQTQEKAIDAGSLNAGNSAVVSWTLVANSSIKGAINITAEGKIFGSVGAHYNYSDYSYSDRIGVESSLVFNFSLDDSPPTINTPSRSPPTGVQPGQSVIVTVNVTDLQSGVRNVTLFYTVDNGTTWENETMYSNLQFEYSYEATIPGQTAGTQVRFKVFASDMLGNNATFDGTTQYTTYVVLPEFQTLPALLTLMMTTLLAAVIHRTKRPRSCVIH